MHENRGISCTFWSADQDRSAKAINRKADTNVRERSDCAVVPGNQPNNERQLSAEVGEGRAQTQENIVPSHMRPTQRGKRMSQGMPGVRQAARKRKQERFTALLHHLNVGLLRDSNAGPVVGSLRFLGFVANRSIITSLRLLVSRKPDSQSFAQWTKAARVEFVETIR